MSRPVRIEDTFSVPEQPALSPDGTRVVYVLRTTDTAADTDVRALWTVGAEEGEPARLTHGRADTAPAWSPDGTRIAFLRAQGGPPQVWILPLLGEAAAVTTLPLGAGAPVWSPDGTKLAFSAPVRTAGGSDTAPIVTDRLAYHADGAGFFGDLRSHLHVLDLATGECAQVTAGDWHAGAPAWSPDGTRVAFPASTGADADLTLRGGTQVLDVTDPFAVPRPVGPQDGFAGPALWSSDGDSVLCVGTRTAAIGHARIFTSRVNGGSTRELTATFDRNVMPGGPGYPGGLPQLAGDGGTLVFCARDRGCTHVFAVPADGGEIRPVLTGADRVASGLSVAGERIAVVLGTPESFGDIVVLDLDTGAERVRTSYGTGAAQPFRRVEREFTGSDGTTVHGWIVRDPARAGAGPLLLDIHGGPHNAWNGAADEIHRYHDELVSRGWTVLLLNPRASDGYGEAFYTATVGGWGLVDAKDLLEPVDALIAEGLADPQRLAVAGYSYGGYMACYLTGVDDRFAAAVAGGVLVDLESFAGTAEDGHLFSSLVFGAARAEDPERYRAMAPLSHVDSVRTPTLVLHGTDDATCPVGQAQQWHTALRARGVPTRLVLYPDAPHTFILDGRPSHRRDWNRRTVEWVTQHTGSGAPAIDAAHWQRRLDTLAARYKVPGAALGILRVGEPDERIAVAYGVLNRDTGVTATPDSLFQIGSNTKVWTATLVMQLVDEGKLDLDAPVSDYLPDLRLSDPDLTKQVTVRHLLTHTSGIDGDVFTDTGRGDDAVEKYVAALVNVAQNHPLGATWSYCNSGFTLAGRIVEVLTGGTYDEALRTRIFEPLGLAKTVTLPEEALLHRAACGHVSPPGADEPVRAPVWGIPRSAGPAGLISSTVSDVLAFARMHLTGGLAADGTRVLSAESAAAMISHQVDLPERYTLGDSWGIGWARSEWDGTRLVGHGGNTIGQSAYFEMIPGQGFAVCLLTNGDNSHDLYEDLYTEIFAELAGVAKPKPIEPPEVPVEVSLGERAGTYERASQRLEVLDNADGPLLRITVTGELAALQPEPTRELPMVAVHEDMYLVRLPTMRTWIPVTFYTLATGERYMHLGVRATPKVA